MASECKSMSAKFNSAWAVITQLRGSSRCHTERISPGIRGLDQARALLSSGLLTLNHLSIMGGLAPKRPELRPALA